MVFPVVMYGCESWTVKKAECQRIDAYVLWCWRRFLRVLWTARRSNQSILKDISPKCLLEGLMLKLKLQYFGHLMRRTHWKRPWCWERLRAGGEGDDRGWDGWMASLTQWTWVWVNSGSWWWTGGLVCCCPWGCKESDMTEQLSWTDDSLWWREALQTLNRQYKIADISFQTCRRWNRKPEPRDGGQGRVSNDLGEGQIRRELPRWTGHRLATLYITYSLVAQIVKNPPAMHETQVWPLGREDPLEKGMVTHSSILSWRIPWTEEPGRLHSPWGCKESDRTEWLTSHITVLSVYKPPKPSNQRESERTLQSLS